MERADVNGPGTQEVYKFLRSATNGAPIDWNFTKFVVGRDGQVLKQFGQEVKPDVLDKHLPTWL